MAANALGYLQHSTLQLRDVKERLDLLVEDIDERVPMQGETSQLLQPGDRLLRSKNTYDKPQAKKRLATSAKA